MNTHTHTYSLSHTHGDIHSTNIQRHRINDNRISVTFGREYHPGGGTVGLIGDAVVLHVRPEDRPTVSLALQERQQERGKEKEKTRRRRTEGKREKEQIRKR